MAPFLGYGLLGLLRPIPARSWTRWLLRGGLGLLGLYSGLLYWILSAWSARLHFLDSMEPIILRLTHVFREIAHVIRDHPEKVLWTLEPAPPWKRMAALVGDWAGRSTARQMRLRWDEPLTYDVHRSLLQMRLRLEGPESVLREQGFVLLQIYRLRDGRPLHPQDWVAFIQLGPIPHLANMEAVTIDFLFQGVTVSPTTGPLRLHYRWNPHYLGRQFPDHLYVCSAYQRDFQTAFTLGCSRLPVVRGALGGALHIYRVLLGSPEDRVEVEKSTPHPVAVRLEVRTLRGHRVLEPDVQTLTRPIQDLQPVLGPSLKAQASPFRGPLVLTLITDRPVRIQHRPYSSE